jgi:hypothetical protein
MAGKTAELAEPKKPDLTDPATLRSAVLRRVARAEQLDAEIADGVYRVAQGARAHMSHVAATLLASEMDRFRRLLVFRDNAEKLMLTEKAWKRAFTVDAKLALLDYVNSRAESSLELMRELAADGVAVSADEAGRLTRARVGERMATLSPQKREMLRAVAEGLLRAVVEDDEEPETKRAELVGVFDGAEEVDVVEPGGHGKRGG